MRAERLRVRPRVFGPLSVALLLHALGLGLAAAFGFTLPVRAEELADTFVLSLSNRASPVGEEGLATTVVAEEGGETEAVWPGTAEEPDADVIPELVAVQLAPEPEELELEPILADAFAAPAEPDAAVAAATPAAAATAVASAPGLGVGPEAEDAGGRPPRAAPTAGTLLFGDAQGTGSPTAVGPRPGKAQGKTQGTAGAPTRTIVVREPKPLETPSPVYPRLARRAGEEGSVLCRLHINAAGKVTQVEVVESSGFPRLDDAARETILGWKFEARLVDGRNVAATLLHRVTFKLES